MVLCLALALAGGVGGCTETNLYSPSMARKEANRVALTGRVCTEDPVEARFPVRVVLLVDRAAGSLYADYDPGATRIDTLSKFVQQALNDPKVSFAVIGYAGRVRKLAPSEGNFTRNPGELAGAISQLSLAEPCISEAQCRDYREGLRSAQALIEGDMASLPAGLRVLTQYVVVVINAGPHAPLALNTDCCPPDDVECLASQFPSHDCESQVDAAIVADLSEAVGAAGAAGLRLHTIQLTAERGPVGDDNELADLVQLAMQKMAFAGGGISQRFDDVGGFSATSLDVLNLRTVLTAKLLFAANLNAIPGPDGPVLDSDGDGLSDEEERSLGSSPGAADTDGDGITDLVEVLAGFDPLKIDLPTACANLNAARDSDLDGLSDCDEALLGTEPTLVDTDGDGLPDKLEVVSSTDYVAPDAEVDSDGDGVKNGDEIRQRSDPRSTDTRAHLTYGYRYELDDEGFVRELFASRLKRITGVEIQSISAGTTPGLGAMVWDHEPDHQTLRWWDAADPGPGPAVDVTEPGVYELPSSSWAPVQGEQGRAVTVEVTPVDFAPDDVTESVRVIYRDRQCINYTVRNVQLMETEPLDDGTPEGMNSIILYFAEAPEGRVEIPGPFRMAQVPVIFDPPAAREPDDALLEVANEEFVRVELVE